MKSIRKAFSFLRVLNSTYILRTIVVALLNAVISIALLVITAQVVNRLSGNDNPRGIIYFAFIAFFIVSLLRLLKEKGYGAWLIERAKIFYYNKARIDDKLNRMAFWHSESSSSQQKLAEMSQMHMIGLFGPDILLENVFGALEALFGLLFSFFLIYRFFTLSSGIIPLWTENTVLILAVLCILLFQIIIQNKITRKIDAIFQDASMENNAQFLFFASHYINIDFAKELRMNTFDIVEKSEQEMLSQNIALIERIAGINRLYESGAAILYFIHLCIIYTAVALKAQAGELLPGDITLYTGLLLLSIGFALDAVQKILVLKKHEVYFKVRDSFMEFPDYDEGDQSICFSKITLDDVHFRYSEQGPDILKGIDYTFETGRKIAIVGENGSGKSTLAKIMCGLYQPTDGVVFYDKCDGRVLLRDSIQKQFAATFQDFKLPNFELGEIVACQSQYCEQKERHLFEQLALETRVNQLKQGLDTIIGVEYDPSGILFSGGELQKTAMARSLYPSKQFLILDEPTSAIDPISERQLYDQFQKIVGDVGLIMISHRLASCQMCDEIIVLSQGQIKEVGNHDTLIRAKGLYYQMWESQKELYNN